MILLINVAKTQRVFGAEHEIFSWEIISHVWKVIKPSLAQFLPELLVQGRSAKSEDLIP